MAVQLGSEMVYRVEREMVVQVEGERVDQQEQVNQTPL